MFPINWRSTKIYNIHYITLHYTIHNITLYITLHFTLYVHYTIYNVHLTLYSICTLYTIQCSCHTTHYMYTIHHVILQGESREREEELQCQIVKVTNTLHNTQQSLREEKRRYTGYNILYTYNV